MNSIGRHEQACGLGPGADVHRVVPGAGPRLRALAAGTVATPGLLVGTRVQLREGAGLKGTVMSYQREFLPGLLGLFPVRLDNAIWQTCHTNDVIVLAPSTQTPPEGRSPHGGEEVTSLSEGGQGR